MNNKETIIILFIFIIIIVIIIAIILWWLLTRKPKKEPKPNEPEISDEKNCENIVLSYKNTDMQSNFQRYLDVAAKSNCGVCPIVETRYRNMSNADKQSNYQQFTQYNCDIKRDYCLTFDPLTGVRDYQCDPNFYPEDNNYCNYVNSNYTALSDDDKKTNYNTYLGYAAAGKCPPDTIKNQYCIAVNKTYQALPQQEKKAQYNAYLNYASAGNCPVQPITDQHCLAWGDNPNEGILAYNCPFTTYYPNCDEFYNSYRNLNPNQ